jgi:hypothetical protein
MKTAQTKTAEIKIRLTTEEIDRIQAVAGTQGGIENWLRSTILGVLEVDEDQEEFDREETENQNRHKRPPNHQQIGRAIDDVIHDFYRPEDREFDSRDFWELHCLKAAQELLSRNS